MSLSSSGVVACDRGTTDLTSAGGGEAAVGEPPRLERNEVGLFLLPRAHVPEADIARWRDWLSRDEVQRLERFRFAEGRHEYLMGKALTRWITAACCDGQPSSMVFTRLSHGKPVLRHVGDLDFNLSHADGVNVLAITRAGPVGVDLERLDPRRGNLTLARRYFAAREYRSLRRMPAPARPEAFLTLWTLKESLLKASGWGLKMPLSDCRFRLRASRIEIDVADELRPAGREWHCEAFRLGGDLIGSWSAAVHPAATLRSRWFEWLPSGGWRPLPLAPRAVGRTDLCGGSDRTLGRV